MNSYSKHLTDEQVRLLLKAIDTSAFTSKRDGCRVVLVKCAECNAPFEEELGVAKERTAGRLDLLCLKCDPDASVPALWGVTVQLGWFLE